ncbi:histidine kinase [Micromonospora sp. WMMD1102]|uniref:sensor histidine kinase n=1 Tax=Micromonospora sp. WMMD1102 TaxID=3016105 RepID=UPI002414E2AC|nr:histidine kinase [Micromonospora sp. WMMD1102]MDG4787291.1 histidine kinase [Micromonospora sp. WMMD1102]
MRRHLLPVVVLPVVVLLAETGFALAGAREPAPSAVLWHATLVAVVIGVRHRAAVAGLIGALLLLALSDGGYVLLLWAAYHAGRESLTRAGTVTLAGALGGALAVELLTAPADPRTIPNLVSTYLVFALLPVLVGRYLAQHERLVASLDRHNRQLRRERELLAEQEQLRERLRIARDMHDSLGHRLSLVSVQAAALEVAELPPVQRQAVRQLAGAARGALDELYELVGALRGGSGADRRATGTDRIGPLVAEFRAAGMPVELREEGEAVPLGEAAGQAAYRVVEEGLTNALKHAPGRPVTVGLRWETDALLLTVDNPLPEAGAPAPHGQAGHELTAHGLTGHGLTGLRERAEQAGGFVAYRIVEAGDSAHPDSGARCWRLLAMLPAAGPADERVEPPGRPGIRTLVLGLVTAALMFVAMPASMLLGVR